MIGSWDIEVESVDFLGSCIAHEDGRTVGSQTEPSRPWSDDPSEIFETHNLFNFLIKQTYAEDSLICGETVVEINKLAIRRPFEVTDAALCERCPLLGGESE